MPTLSALLHEDHQTCKIIAPQHSSNVLFWMVLRIRGVIYRIIGKFKKSFQDGILSPVDFFVSN